ncbi:MAG: GntR family transcriptional regulator [Pseudomonadota bacterium]
MEIALEALKQRKSLVDQTYEALLDAICAGAFAPGERLQQDDLAERLNVSRQPVNSAIAMLRAQGFVEETGRRGVVVAEVNEKLFEAIYQFRSAVEPLAVDLATSRMTEESIRIGRDIIARGRALVAANDTSSVIGVDMEFHTLLYDLSGNPIVSNTMYLNWRHLQRAMGPVLQLPGASLLVWNEHEAIFDAMVAGQSDQAARLMRAHIVEAQARVLTG